MKNLDEILAVVAEIAMPREQPPEAIGFVLGHGETIIGHWLAQGHALVRFQRAVEPRPPGTSVADEDVEIDPSVPAVWWMFEDAEAVRRMRDYLDTIVVDMGRAALAKAEAAR